ncbi:MAG: choice-of-anchor D domain-containing protein [Myxococcota bacterium]
MPILLALLTLTACNDAPGLNSIANTELARSPTILVEPTTLDFGVIPLGETVEDVVTLTNMGDADLQLLYIGVEGADAYQTDPLPWDRITPGKSIDVPISYTPYDSQDVGLLRVVTDDPIYPDVTVDLLGRAAYPELSITPNPLILATASPGEETYGSFTLSNTGAAALLIDQVTLSGATFSLDPVASPIALSPNAQTQVTVRFLADEKGIYEGRVWTADNTIAGSSSAGVLGASDVPVALCDVNPSKVAPLQESATWIGEESFDASGAPLEQYRWTLVERPDGSVAELPESNGLLNQPNLEGFVPDLAGNYIAELVVVNEMGEASAPCRAILEAVPDQNLWIELFWDQVNDDMDLHLLRPGGELRTDGDCYYDNCVDGGPDWGQPGETADNPSLDIDDIYGTGPENVNIAMPEHGVFTVVVHDYKGSTPDFLGINHVSVNIFLGGELVWTDTRPIQGDDTFTPFAEISWPDGEITAVE